MSLTASKITRQFVTEAESRDILRGLDLTVASGEAIAIMGPSGSGKSTLLNILGTLDKPTTGTLDIGGANPFTLSDTELARFRNRTIGFIFQMHHLLPQCSALENVLLPTAAFGDGPAADVLRVRAETLLDRVGLKSRMHDRPSRLSGGERQRVAVARALINSPKLLLADEPTGSLDHASAENIAALLCELKKEERLALVVVTHSIELARRMDRILNLDDGVLRPAEARA
jgi:ABC-type lipoprotein export system ATPase subunit